MEGQTKVWDPVVRVFHWSLVFFFLVDYISGEDFELVHVWSGYIIILLLAVRVAWGFVGTQHARFIDFVTRPKTAKQYFIDTLRKRAPRYLGHNPAGGWMILLLIASLLLTTFSGIALYAAAEHAGPLADTFISGSKYWKGIFKDLHEFFANFSVLLVVIHIGGVIIESNIHKENLVRSMWTGYKRSA